MRLSYFLIPIALAMGTLARAQEVDPEKIAAIWKEREAKVQTAEFRWTVTIKYAKGGYSLQHPFPDQRSLGLPPEEMEYSYASRLLIDGVKARYDYENLNWDIQKKKLTPTVEMLAFDGAFTRSYYLNAQFGYTDTGNITNREAGFRDAKMPLLRPVFGAFRGRTQGLAHCQPHEFRSTGRHQTINGDKCVEVLAAQYQSGGTRHLWLAPAKDWLVVRDVYKSSATGFETKDEIWFEPHPVVKWVPTNFETTLSVHTKLAYTVSCRVDQYEFNRPIAPTAFAPRFPTGLTVFDLSVPGSIEGTILPDGRLQPKNGKRAYYLPGEVNAPSSFYYRVALASILALCDLGLLIRLLIRFRRNRRSLVAPPFPA